jgi:hypothetical protein
MVRRPPDELTARRDARNRRDRRVPGFLHVEATGGWAVALIVLIVALAAIVTVALSVVLEAFGKLLGAGPGLEWLPVGLWIGWAIGFVTRRHPAAVNGGDDAA